MMFGTPRDRSPEQLVLISREWFNALRSYGSVIVAGAITWAIESQKFWPALAVVVERCRSEQDSWLDALGLNRDGSTRSNEPTGISDAYRTWRSRNSHLFGPVAGADQPSEEAERTAAMCAPVKVEPKPASQDMGPPSPELKEAIERRRIAALRDAELKREATRPDDELEER